MKIWKRILLALGAMIAIGGVIAGVLDWIDQKKDERDARAEGRRIHKTRGPYEKYFKRPLDFILSSAAIVVLSPVLLIIAALVRIKLGSPVAFAQERPGKDEKVFSMLKFRSMTNCRDAEGNLLPDDERLTKFGRLLRSTSCDELLELFCIWKGKMSIVGPRPLLVSYLPFYSEEEHHRHDVRPGLTGLAQVNGRNAISKWEERFQYDLEYVNNITFVTDVKILFRTVYKVIKRSDIQVGSEIKVGRLDAARSEYIDTKV